MSRCILCAEKGRRAILLARPCSWDDWQSEPPSRLEIWRESKNGWTKTGTIGPWHEPGVIWEVPQLIELGGKHVLIMSVVDRRGGSARCTVRYWLGGFTGASFELEAVTPNEGLLLDGGPDFYAAIVNARSEWRGEGRVIVGWASSWDYARKLIWPGGGAGGPISLPRQIALSPCGSFIRQRPLDAHRSLCWMTLPVSMGENLVLRTADSMISLTLNDGLAVTVERPGFARHSIAMPTPPPFDPQIVSLFRDGPLLEVFVEPLGLTVTASIPAFSDRSEMSALSHRRAMERTLQPTTFVDEPMASLAEKQMRANGRDVGGVGH